MSESCSGCHSPALLLVARRLEVGSNFRVRALVSLAQTCQKHASEGDTDHRIYGGRAQILDARCPCSSCQQSWLDVRCTCALFRALAASRMMRHPSLTMCSLITVCERCEHLTQYPSTSHIRFSLTRPSRSGCIFLFSLSHISLTLAEHSRVG